MLSLKENIYGTFTHEHCACKQTLKRKICSLQSLLNYLISKGSVRIKIMNMCHILCNFQVSVVLQQILYSKTSSWGFPNQLMLIPVISLSYFMLSCYSMHTFWIFYNEIESPHFTLLPTSDNFWCKQMKTLQCNNQSDSNNVP